MKKKISITLSALILLGCLNMASCKDSAFGGRKEGVLRVASWDEYICMGGNDSFTQDGDPLYEEFEDWYEKTYPEKGGIMVEYVALQDNETMYSKIKMGDSYDLLCPSEYMIMKLAAENKLERFDSSFYDTSIKENYYAQHVSPYILDIFKQGEITGSEYSWADYAAGYMWGTTGFVFNPNKIDREIMTKWNAFTNKEISRKITAKDNVRDSYFVGLGMLHEEELLRLNEEYEANKILYKDDAEKLAEIKSIYKSTLSKMMNDTSVKTMGAVKEELIKMRKNVYGLETDEAKLDVLSGRLDASFQWSGDAVYIIDEAEDNDLSLEYSIPKSTSNLWFDGWVMMKGANTHAATAFINFLSRPDNVVRNMYYIGYTSCIAGNPAYDYAEEEIKYGNMVFDYVSHVHNPDVDEVYYGYGKENGDAIYDLSYFFGEGHAFTTSQEQLRRQLFAQYPDVDTIDRLVVMDYFDKETNERANRMWINIK